MLVTHQFVTGGVRSESEDITVGGTDNVDAAVFDGFDYVALGHLHGAQSIGRETLRYSGTPLKYSFSEKDQEKSITVVELGEKGSVSISTLPLRPQRDMREVRGTYEGFIKQVQIMREFASGRPESLKQQIQKEFGLSDSYMQEVFG